MVVWRMVKGPYSLGVFPSRGFSARACVLELVLPTGKLASSPENPSTSCESSELSDRSIYTRSRCNCAQKRSLRNVCLCRTASQRSGGERMSPRKSSMTGAFAKMFFWGVSSSTIRPNDGHKRTLGKALLRHQNKISGEAVSSQALQYFSSDTCSQGCRDH